MRNDIEKVLYSEEVILKKVKEMAKKISDDYREKDLLMVVILKGSVIFASDLIKNIDIPCDIDFMAVSSYGSGSESSGNVVIKKDIDGNIEGRDILIVEDIVDTGNTLSFLVDYFKEKKANTVKIVTLLDKPSRRNVNVDVEYSGFEVPNEFLVGYGLDYNEKYRNLPFVGILKSSIYS